MRIVAWNIRAGGGRRVDAIARQLHRWAPDVVALSEFRATAPSLALAARLAADGLPHQTLSDREYEVFGLLVTGATVSDIAAQLHLSGKTVSTHKARILEKMGMDSVADLVRYAMAHKLIDSRDD